MKQQVSPVVAAVVIIVIVGVAALAWMQLSGGGVGSKEGEKPPGMPADVAEKFKELGNKGMAGPGGGPGGMTAPAGGTAGGQGMSGPPGGMGGMTAPSTSGQ